MSLDLSSLKLNQCLTVTSLYLYYISVDDYSIIDQQSRLTELSFINSTNTVLKTLSIKKRRLNQIDRASLIEGLSLNTSITSLHWDFIADFEFDNSL
ncbi:hypothetical protein GEMRC1_005431 [Eukaryota sp. GEM-RC1]